MISILAMPPQHSEVKTCLQSVWQRSHTEMEWCDAYEHIEGALEGRHRALVLLCAPPNPADERLFLRTLRYVISQSTAVVAVWSEEVSEEQWDCWAQVGVENILHAGMLPHELPVRLRWILSHAMERGQSSMRADRAELAVKGLPPLMEQAIDGIFISDRDGRYIDINRAACEMLHYTRDELLGMKVSDVIHPEDLLLTPLRQSVIKGGSSVRTERRMLRKDGAPITIEFSAHMHEDGRIVAFARDISRRREAELALRQERDRAQAYLDLAGVMFVSLDPDGVVTLANDKACELLGFDEDEMVGRNWFTTFVPEPFRENSLQAFLQSVQSGRLGSMERVEDAVLTRDGSIRYVMWNNALLREIDGRVSGLLGSGEDITEQRRAEMALRASEEQLRTTLMSIGDAVIATDLQGHIVEMNHVAEHLSGVNACDARGSLFSQVFDVLDEYTHQPVPDMVSLVLGQEEVVDRTHNILLQHRNGSLRPVAERGSPIRDNNGEITGVVVVCRDRSEARQAEQAEWARAAAEASNQAKSEFLAMMSHEIRTPLNAVVGITSLLLSASPSLEQREYVETLHGAAQTLQTLLNDILDFSKIEAGKLDMENAPFHVRHTIENVSVLLAEKAHRKGLELAVWVDPNLSMKAVGDASRLRQVLTNLVDNAIKFTEQGEVLISAELAEKREGEWFIRFEVRDTGIGMNEEQRNTVFEPFAQAHRGTSRELMGTGLGLAISNRLVHLMGGTMGVESTPEQGSLFWFTVRLQTTVDEDASLLDFSSWPELRMLVGLRYPLAMEALSHLLHSWGIGHDLCCESDILSQVEESLEQKEPYDLVLLDAEMEETSGVDVARKLRALGDASPCVIVLVPFEQRGTETSWSESLDGVVPLYKPIRQSDLYNLIHQEFVSPALIEPDTEDDIEGVVTKNVLGRVLVVEDNKVNQKVARWLLQKLGYHVEVAENGKEAIVMVQMNEYHAILMDCQMPVMDGYQATREIRQLEGKRGKSVIIAMTAEALRGERERCLEAGMDDYLPKPVNLEKLQATLERWL
ncbi:MAG: PAS domain S-box protein [Deltaproteobacteria bacterium]|nr:MAG: PAS domain S-box protein [Deltaproteobacteria bacterium]